MASYACELHFMWRMHADWTNTISFKQVTALAWWPRCLKLVLACTQIVGKLF